MTEPTPAAPTPAAPAKPAKKKAPAQTIATVWFIMSILIGATFIIGTPYAAYGGDAYTGIQNAVARGTNALGWLIIGTGVIALVTAIHKYDE